MFYDKVVGRWQVVKKMLVNLFFVTDNFEKDKNFVNMGYPFIASILVF